MRRIFGAILLGLATTATEARAQGPATYGVYTGPSSLYGSPGYYGTSWGTAGYGVTRTFSAFNSPYGAGYAYGSQPPGFIPNKYGVGLWRPGFAAPGYTYGAPASYRTFPVQDWPVPSGFGPSIGVYAPGFGPSPFLVR